MTEILPLLDRLLTEGQDMLRAGYLVFLRVGAAMAVLPAFGEQSVPVRVRVVLALAFTVIVAPAVDLPPGDYGITAILAEVSAGLLLGIGFRMFILALQTAGAMIAQATTLSQIFAGAGAEPQAAIGHVLVVAGLALAVTTGLHLRVAETLILSYEVLPAGRFANAADVSQWGLAQVTRSFVLAFSLAVPFLVASLIYNAALGVINRAMPQLMVAFVGAPALTAGGLILLALAAPLVLTIWVQALHGFLDAPFSVPQ